MELLSEDFADDAARSMRALAGLLEVHRARTLGETYERALAVVEDAFGTPRAAILLIDDQVARFVHSHGLSTTYQAAVEGHFPWQLDDPSPAPIVVEDVAINEEFASYRELFQREKIGALAFVPIMADGKLAGKFMLYFEVPRRFGQNELTLAVACANHVGFALSRHQASRQLEASRQDFRALTDAVPMAVAVHRDGAFLYVNPSLVDLLRCGDAQALLGEPVDSVVHPESRTEDGGPLQCRVCSRWGSMNACRLLRSDGSSVAVECADISVDFDGAPAVAVVMHDLTKSRELTGRLLQAERMISMGMMAGSLGHEINNPLSYVSANAEYAVAVVKRMIETSSRSDADLERLVEALADLIKGTEQIAGVVAHLSELSRRGADATMRPIDMEQVIASAVSMSHHRLTGSARLIVDCRVAQPVRGVRTRLVQLFVNLIANAGDSLPPAASDAEVRVTCTDEGDWIVAKVSDTGTGMGAAVLERLFEPLVTTKESGTGMGLAICREIVEEHRGEILCDSEEGRGTTVTVRMPRDPEELEAPAAEVGREAPPCSRVLLIDDDPFVLSALMRLLASQHTVSGVTSAEKALSAIASEERFDLIVCDVMMPATDGMAFFDEVSKHHPDLLGRLVFMTAGAFTPAAAAFVAKDSVRCIPKPISADALDALLTETSED